MLETRNNDQKKTIKPKAEIDPHESGDDKADKAFIEAKHRYDSKDYHQAALFLKQVTLRLNTLKKPSTFIRKANAKASYYLFLCYANLNNKEAEQLQSLNDAVLHAPKDQASFQDMIIKIYLARAVLKHRINNTPPHVNDNKNDPDVLQDIRNALALCPPQTSILKDTLVVILTKISISTEKFQDLITDIDVTQLIQELQTKAIEDFLSALRDLAKGESTDLQKLKEGLNLISLAQAKENKEFNQEILLEALNRISFLIKQIIVDLPEKITTAASKKNSIHTLDTLSKILLKLSIDKEQQSLVYDGLGCIQMSENAFKKARKLYTKAITLYPTPEYYFHRASVSKNLATPEENISDLNQALQLNPDYKPAQLLLIHIRRGSTEIKTPQQISQPRDEKKKAASEILDNDFSAAARKEWADNDHESGIEEVDKAFVRGRILFKKQQSREAFKAFKTALTKLKESKIEKSEKNKKTQAKLYYCLGCCYLIENKQKEAITAFDHAIKNTPLKGPYELLSFEFLQMRAKVKYAYYSTLPNKFNKENQTDVLKDFEEALKICPSAAPHKQELLKNMVHIFKTLPHEFNQYIITPERSYDELASSSEAELSNAEEKEKTQQDMDVIDRSIIKLNTIPSLIQTDIDFAIYIINQEIDLIHPSTAADEKFKKSLLASGQHLYVYIQQSMKRYYSLNNIELTTLYSVSKTYIRISTDENRSAYAFYVMGMISLQQHKYEQALTHFSSAIILDVGEVSKLLYLYFYSRAIAHENLNQIDEAVNDQQRSLKIRPDFLDADRALKRLLEKQIGLEKKVKPISNKPTPKKIKKKSQQKTDLTKEMKETSSPTSTKHILSPELAINSAKSLMDEAKKSSVLTKQFDNYIETIKKLNLALDAKLNTRDILNLISDCYEQTIKIINKTENNPIQQNEFTNVIVELHKTMDKRYSQSISKASLIHAYLQQAKQALKSNLMQETQRILGVLKEIKNTLKKDDIDALRYSNQINDLDVNINKILLKQQADEQKILNTSDEKQLSAFASKVQQEKLTIQTTMDALLIQNNAYAADKELMQTQLKLAKSSPQTAILKAAQIIQTKNNEKIITSPEINTEGLRKQLAEIKLNDGMRNKRWIDKIKNEISSIEKLQSSFVEISKLILSTQDEITQINITVSAEAEKFQKIQKKQKEEKLNALDDENVKRLEAEVNNAKIEILKIKKSLTAHKSTQSSYNSRMLEYLKKAKSDPDTALDGANSILQSKLDEKSVVIPSNKVASLRKSLGKLILNNPERAKTKKAAIQGIIDEINKSHDEILTLKSSLATLDKDINSTNILINTAVHAFIMKIDSARSTIEKEFNETEEIDRSEAQIEKALNDLKLIDDLIAKLNKKNLPRDLEKNYLYVLDKKHKLELQIQLQQHKMAAIKLADQEEKIKQAEKAEQTLKTFKQIGLSDKMLSELTLLSKQYPSIEFKGSMASYVGVLFYRGMVADQKEKLIDIDMLILDDDPMKICKSLKATGFTAGPPVLDQKSNLQFIQVHKVGPNGIKLDVTIGLKNDYKGTPPAPFINGMRLTQKYHGDQLIAPFIKGKLKLIDNKLINDSMYQSYDFISLGNGYSFGFNKENAYHKDFEYACMDGQLFLRQYLPGWHTNYCLLVVKALEKMEKMFASTIDIKPSLKPHPSLSDSNLMLLSYGDMLKVLQEQFITELKSGVRKHKIACYLEISTLVKKLGFNNKNVEPFIKLLLRAHILAEYESSLQGMDVDIIVNNVFNNLHNLYFHKTNPTPFPAKTYNMRVQFENTVRLVMQLPHPDQPLSQISIHDHSNQVPQTALSESGQTFYSSPTIAPAITYNYTFVQISDLYRIDPVSGEQRAFTLQELYAQVNHHKVYTNVQGMLVVVSPRAIYDLAKSDHPETLNQLYIQVFVTIKSPVLQTLPPVVPTGRDQKLTPSLYRPGFYRLPPSRPPKVNMQSTQSAIGNEVKKCQNNI